MRLLLDECLPRRFKGELPGHNVATVPEMGWAGFANGELLSLAKGQFDAFLTSDQGVEFQLNLAQDDIPIVVLVAGTNRFEDLKPLAPQALAALESIMPGEVVRISA